jgi:hypothetical protein
VLKVIFHVGMGKTGSTTIQRSLATSSALLAAAKTHYLGQWMEIVHPDFDKFKGFQAFLRQAPDQMIASAERLLARIAALHQETGAETFVISNEQYLENIPRLKEFFAVLAAKVQLQFIIFVRPPASWLPSAYIQWGVLHKTNRGPVQPFGIKARQLMRQYGFVAQWHAVPDTSLSVRPFDETLDVVQDFGQLIGIDLPATPTRQQVRSSASETLLRAACNTASPEPALPELYNAIRPPQPAGAMPLRLSEKFSYLFDRQEIPKIIAENLEPLTYIEGNFGIDMISPAGSAPERFDLPDLSDELIGTMLDMVFSQALQIQDLRARLEALERQNTQQ